MRLGLAFVAVSIILTGVAIGQDDPIAARQQLMKMNGAALKTSLDMVQEKVAFDAAQAAKAMNTIVSDIETFPTLFPEGSDVGDTKASPEIWTNNEEFKALAAKLATDAKAAAEAAGQGLGAFKTAFAAVGADCGACHKQFRLR